MKIQKGYITLVIMLAVAALAMLVSFVVIRQRSQNPPPAASQTSTDNSTSPTPDQTQTLPPTPAPVQTSLPAGWLTYVNSKYGFQLQYPPNLKVGTVSGNSVLGTYSAPIKGFHVGPLVLVVLKDASLKKIGSDYFNGFYNPSPAAAPADQSLPAASCKTDKITNTQVTSIKSVSCTGEGGAGTYAYIQGPSYDVFVDGYSKGYDSQDFGSLAKTTDYANILSMFKFGSAGAPVTQASAPTPAIQNFSITADDSTATPLEISAAKGAIVEITFNVSSSNVYHGGLDFRSSVVNSGTVLSGQSKTISFTATQSFSFTPYWPSTNIAKGYTIKVTVQ